MDQFFITAWYEQVFRCQYLESRGNQFQDLFANIMERCHPGDFIRTRPWGNRGDRKNDGYLGSERTLFQVYGPNEMTESDAISKIDEDYYSALPHWQVYFDTWVFVHNSASGLGPGITERLLHHDQGHQNIAVRSWGYPELLQRVRRLGNSDLMALFGAVPTRNDFLNVTIPDLQAVLNFIAAQPVPAEPDLSPVSVTKMDYNGVPPGIQSFLMAGRLRVRSVEDFFGRSPVVELGDQIAEAFRREYQRLQDQGASTDDIFAGLQIFAGGQPPLPVERSAAVWTIIAYLFDACDIFERPREDQNP